MCHFVLVFFSPFSIAITSLGEERANLSAFHRWLLTINDCGRTHLDLVFWHSGFRLPLKPLLCFIICVFYRREPFSGRTYVCNLEQYQN